MRPFDDDVAELEHAATGPRPRSSAKWAAVLDAQVARAVLQVLAESWPEDADVERIAIAQGKPGHVIVTAWIAGSAPVIGPRDAAATELRDRLGEAVPQVSVELRIEPVLPSEEPGGLRVQDLLGEADIVRQAPFRGPTLEEPDARVRDLVPGLVGMRVADAHSKAKASGFALVTADPDGAPITARSVRGEYERWLVVAQSPDSGVLAPLHSQIVVDIEDRGGGGESGDREPRVPRPPGGVAHLERMAIDEGE